MVKEMSQKLTAQMVRNNVVDAAKAPIYAYGIELLLSTLAGVLALVTITLIKRTLRRDNVPHWAGRATVSCLPLAYCAIKGEPI